MKFRLLDFLFAKPEQEKETTQPTKPVDQETFDEILKEIQMRLGKGLLRSKTFWTNLTVAAISLGTYFTDSGVITPETAAIFGTVIGGLNVFLRLLTSEPIAGTPAAKKAE